MHKLRSLVAVLALGIPVLASAQPAKKADPTSTFLTQDKYTYCDVKILAALWKQSISDAKATVGLKLQAKSDKVIDAALVDARKNAAKKGSARCTFSEAGFTYQDAQKLATIWKQTEADAKLMAEAKIMGGAEKYVRELVKGPSSGGSKDPTSTYLEQDKYDYCDVKLLAALWKSSISDAKATVGAKLQSKNEVYLDSELAKARKKPAKRCTWDEAGLSYSDIEKLAKMWKISITKAKAQASAKATTYGGAYVRGFINDVSNQADADLAAFLRQDKYTYCDAAMIASMWKQSVEEGKQFIGLKLSSKNTAAIDQAIADARVAAKTKPVAGCGTAPTKKAPPTKAPATKVQTPATKAPATKQ